MPILVNVERFTAIPPKLLCFDLTSEISGGYLEVQCSDLFCILACQLLLQALGDIHSQRALAKVPVAKLHRKGTPWRIFLEAFEVVVKAEIPCLAKTCETAFCAREILGALHARHDLFNPLPILLFHTLSLMPNIYFYTYFLYSFYRYVLYDEAQQSAEFLLLPRGP